ncbi:hypothetical protein DAPPUDRAFT_106167 [Daphnia pulex]|uniref:Uncharacterized protein n=1 Tax=Daphnia pulex TaxID=6669 RepID=E9GT90_DAPPU|nr:hypothetical protein DAPPUDRAFT_106167 [Daphnia pulex]|eukprot:EFX77235.1 hypothetical protein DAPPUDRAFT_106167 [Daphnia pulex]
MRGRCQHCHPGQPALCNYCGRASYKPADIGVVTRSRQANQPIVAVENPPVNVAEPVVAVENPPVNVAEQIVAVENPPVNMADLTQILTQLTAMQRIMIDQQQENQEQISGLHRENQRQASALTVALDGHGGGNGPLPKFGGSANEDVFEWIEAVEKIATAARWTPAKQRRMAAAALHGQQQRTGFGCRCQLLKQYHHVTTSSVCRRLLVFRLCI